MPHRPCFVEKLCAGELIRPNVFLLLDCKKETGRCQLLPLKLTPACWYFRALFGQKKRKS